MNQSTKRGWETTNTSMEIVSESLIFLRLFCWDLRGPQELELGFKSEKLKAYFARASVHEAFVKAAQK